MPISRGTACWSPSTTIASTGSQTGTGAIAELGVVEVDAADAGFTFSPDGGSSFPFRGHGIRVPRLEEILVRWPEVRINIDPKSDPCVGPLVALLDRLGAWSRVCIGSFSDRRLRRIRGLSRGAACTSMGPRSVALARLAATFGTMARLGADCVQVPMRRGPFPIVTERFVKAAHRAGLPVHVWTINDEATMDELLDLGVDAIMSDRLRLLQEVFTRRGLPLAGTPGTQTCAGASAPDLAPQAGSSRRARNRLSRLADAMQAVLARVGPAEGLARGLAQLALDQQAPGAGDVGDAAGEVDGPPEPVAGAREGGPQSCARTHLREILTLGVRRVEQPQGCVQQRLGLERGEHRGVADRLDQPHGRLGDLGGERFQARRQAAKLIRRDFLAEAGEADEVRKADRHFARAGETPPLRSIAPTASLCAAWRRCSASRLCSRGSSSG